MSVFEASVDPADYMRRIASSTFGFGYKQLARSKMRLTSGARVLDLGCGPGTDLAAYADAVGPEGEIVGVDHSQDAVDQAARATGHLSQVRIVHADVHDLRLAAASFDAAHTDRVLQHVDDPLLVLRNVSQLLRFGGTAVLAEPHRPSLVVDHPEGRLSRAYTDYVVRHQIRNPSIGSRLPRLTQQVGLHVDQVHPVTVVFSDVRAADQIFGFSRVTERPVAHGSMSRSDGRRWLDHLATTQAFFASTTIYITVAQRTG